jgi:hypothetical protein
MKEEGGEIRRNEEDIDTGGGKRKKEEVEGYRHKQRTHVLVYMNQHLHAHYKYTSKLILCSLSFLFNILFSLAQVYPSFLPFITRTSSATLLFI